MMMFMSIAPLNKLESDLQLRSLQFLISKMELRQPWPSPNAAMRILLLAYIIFFCIAAVVEASATRGSVLAYLRQIEGHHTISGQHNREPNASPAQWTNKVHDITGVYPGLWEGDFLYSSNDDINNRQTMINEAKAQWAAGSLVGLMWHSCPPNMSEPCSWTDVKSKLTPAEWRKITPLWKAKLDIIVPFLQQLKDAGVPVLWRPLHEINSGWSWWGGDSANSAKLFQTTYNYLVGTKKLTNLIWVWSVKDDAGASSGLGTFYPGNQYVDIIALDPWVNGFPTSEWYSAIQGVSSSKPIALAEVGTLPTPTQLAAQPKWTYFSEWAEYLTGSNSNDAVKATYYDPQVLHRGDFSL